MAHASKQDRIGAYKRILRECIDQRPSGMRRKIAEVLGTHKSFISQLTNPADPTPLPARHVDAIADVCHLSREELRRFMDAYREAHPEQHPQTGEHHRRYRTLHIQIPVLDDPVRQQRLEALIKDNVRRLCDLLHED